MNGAIPVTTVESDYDYDHGAFFLDHNHIIQEIPIDKTDQDDEETDSYDDYEEADDSFYVFKGHTNELHSVACSPINASLVATGGKDHKGFMWKVGSQQFGVELRGHEETVSNVAFSSDGHFLATGSLDGLIQVWDANLVRIKCRLRESKGGIEWLKWHPNEYLVLAGSEDSRVYLWNACINVCLKTFYGHSTCGDFSPDGNIICIGYDDASLRIWNLKTGQRINVEGHPYHASDLTCLSITHDSTVAATGSLDGSVHMVNLATGKVVNSLLSHTASVACIGHSPSLRWAASGSFDQKLIIWDIQRSCVRCTCQHEGGVMCLAWIGTSRYVATGSMDRKVRIWDCISGICIRTFSGHTNVVRSLAVTADHKYLVSVSKDGTTRVFTIEELR